MAGDTAKLAMLVHLLDQGHGNISEAATERAIRWSIYMKGHAKRIYSLANLADEEDAVRLLERIKTGVLSDGFTAHDLKRKGWAGLSKDANVEAALSSLVATGWLRPQPTTVGAGGMTGFHMG